MNRPLTCVSYRVLKCLKFLPLILEPWACADKSEHVQMNFLATVTEGVVYGVYKAVTRPSFSVAR